MDAITLPFAIVPLFHWPAAASFIFVITIPTDPAIAVVISTTFTLITRDESANFHQDSFVSAINTAKVCAKPCTLQLPDTSLMPRCHALPDHVTEPYRATGVLRPVPSCCTSHWLASCQTAKFGVY
ncbi:hypothetical protein ACJJTC_007118 [Scirpophaga incertulas]